MIRLFGENYRFFPLLYTYKYYYIEIPTTAFTSIKRNMKWQTEKYVNCYYTRALYSLWNMKIKLLCYYGNSRMQTEDQQNRNMNISVARLRATLIQRRWMKRIEKSYMPNKYIQNLVIACLYVFVFEHFYSLIALVLWSKNTSNARKSQNDNEGTGERERERVFPIRIESDDLCRDHELDLLLLISWNEERNITVYQLDYDEYSMNNGKKKLEKCSDALNIIHIILIFDIFWLFLFISMIWLWWIQ